MDTRVDPDRSALRLAERLNQILDRGGFSATYKYAVLVALMDLCLELTNRAGVPPDVITTRQLAEKVLELYWPHCAPYGPAGAVLRQNRVGHALIIRHIVRYRERVDPRSDRSLPLSRARALGEDDKSYEQLVRDVEWSLIEMPLLRLQVIGQEEDRFLYEYAFGRETKKTVVTRYQKTGEGPFDNRLTLKPGVSAALIAVSALMRPLIHRHWAMMVASMNGLKEFELDEFLFGAKRISLLPVKSGLLELQAGRCFYCEKAIPSQRTCAVDHFVPWSRHADNSIDNLVAAHDQCNGKKSDFLAAAEHVERWRGRSRLHAPSMLDLAQKKCWDSRPERTLSVARAIYGALPDDARLWKLGSVFEKIEPDRIARALAAGSDARVA